MPNTAIYLIRSQEPKSFPQSQQWLAQVSTFLYDRLMQGSVNSTMLQIVSQIPWNSSASAAPNATTYATLPQPLMDPAPQNTYTTANTLGHLSTFSAFSHLSLHHLFCTLPELHWSEASYPRLHLLPLLRGSNPTLIMVLPPEHFAKHWSSTRLLW